MKNRFEAWVLPAEGVKIENSSMVNVEGVEQVVAFFVMAGNAEERADKARTRRVGANMAACGEEYCCL